MAVYDSASGQRLYRIEVPKEKTGYDVSGRRLARLGDVNGDGSADFGIGIPHTLASRGRSGILRIYIGADGELIREHSETIERSDFAGSLMGQHNAGLGDIDGDGIADYGSLTGSGGGQEARLTRRVIRVNLASELIGYQ